eukprot:GHVS01091550.1.p1 GENE.GHVS01091550.1~~GHVS01091550.1.p1  ORF type:complete len:660 (+),score=172.82 GHVS01091550.1:55-1980(+)
MTPSPMQEVPPVPPIASATSFTSSTAPLNPKASSPPSPLPPANHLFPSFPSLDTSSGLSSSLDYDVSLRFPSFFTDAPPADGSSNHLSTTPQTLVLPPSGGQTGESFSPFLRSSAHPSLFCLQSPHSSMLPSDTSSSSTSIIFPPTTCSLTAESTLRSSLDAATLPRVIPSSLYSYPNASRGDASSSSTSFVNTSPSTGPLSSFLQPSSSSPSIPSSDLSTFFPVATSLLHSLVKHYKAQSPTPVSSALADASSPLVYHSTAVDTISSPSSHSSSPQSGSVVESSRLALQAALLLLDSPEGFPSSPSSTVPPFAIVPTAAAADPSHSQRSLTSSVTVPLGHPSMLAHPDEFRNPSSFLKIYGDPMCGQSSTPTRGSHGNWVCAKCANVNYPRRFRCNKCSAYRDHAGDVVVYDYAKTVYALHVNNYEAAVGNGAGGSKTVRGDGGSGGGGAKSGRVKGSGSTAGNMSASLGSSPNCLQPQHQRYNAGGPNSTIPFTNPAFLNINVDATTAPHPAQDTASPPPLFAMFRQNCGGGKKFPVPVGRGGGAPVLPTPPPPPTAPLVCHRPMTHRPAIAAEDVDRAISRHNSRDKYGYTFNSTTDFPPLAASAMSLSPSSCLPSSSPHNSSMASAGPEGGQQGSVC